MFDDAPRLLVGARFFFSVSVSGGAAWVARQPHALLTVLRLQRASASNQTKSALASRLLSVPARPFHGRETEPMKNCIFTGALMASLIAVVAVGCGDDHPNHSNKP